MNLSAWWVLTMLFTSVTFYYSESAQSPRVRQVCFVLSKLGAVTWVVLSIVGILSAYIITP
jgi:hypothetical protein